MIDEDVSDQIVSEVAAIEKAKVLLGLMRKPIAKQWMELDYSVRHRWGPQLSKEEKEDALEDHKEEYLKQYEEAKSALSQTPPFTEREITLQDPPDDPEIQEHIDEFVESDYFQEAYGDVPEGQWSIKLVPLKCLVAWQSHVTTEAHEEIPTSDDGQLDVIKYCLPIDVRNYLMVNRDTIPDRLASVGFVSRNPNVNFSGPRIDSIEDRPAGNVSVTFNVKTRPNFVQVDHWQDRYILANGYHRSYQLLKEGEEYIPAVVREVGPFQQTAAAGSGWFSAEMITGARPPLVYDFTTDVAVELEVKGTNKIVRFTAEKFDVQR